MKIQLANVKAKSTTGPREFCAEKKNITRQEQKIGPQLGEQKKISTGHKVDELGAAEDCVQTIWLDHLQRQGRGPGRPCAGSWRTPPTSSLGLKMFWVQK